MTQRAIPAVFRRGGSSKGVFFHARDLPGDRAALDPILLAVLGSPDPYGRQLDGMGGGISSLSKAVIVGPPTRPDCDVDYRSEEHTSELQSLMRISYAVFCLKKKKIAI